MITKKSLNDLRKCLKILWCEIKIKNFIFYLHECRKMKKYTFLTETFFVFSILDILKCPISKIAKNFWKKTRHFFIKNKDK